MISHEIIGDDMQAVIITMGQGDQIRAEAGAMMYMTDSIEMDAKMEGGFLGALKRNSSRARASFTHFLQRAWPCRLRGAVSGKIVALDLHGQPLLCQKDAFLCAQGDIDISIAFTKRIGAGFFGGEGFILQKIEGAWPIAFTRLTVAIATK